MAGRRKEVFLQRQFPQAVQGVIHHQVRVQIEYPLQLLGELKGGKNAVVHLHGVAVGGGSLGQQVGIGGHGNQGEGGLVHRALQSGEVFRCERAVEDKDPHGRAGVLADQAFEHHRQGIEVGAVYGD